MKHMDNLVHEYDSKRRIVHLTASGIIETKTPEEGLALYSATRDIFSKYADGGRFYLIVDVSRIKIDPGLVDTYNELMTRLSDEFLYENGRAAYGYEITRLTIFMAHNKKGLDDPHFFASRYEAEAFIDSLIQQRQDAIRTESGKSV